MTIQGGQHDFSGRRDVGFGQPFCKPLVLCLDRFEDFHVLGKRRVLPRRNLPDEPQIAIGLLP